VIERFAHYSEQAEKLRKMAEAEPSQPMRDQLLDLAAQYQKLADTLAAARHNSN